MICTPCQILKGDQIKDNGMAGACDMHGRKEETFTGFWRENLKEGYHWKS
jgi:hypothetical protein